MSHATQSLLARAMLDPDQAAPPGLTSWNGGCPDRRVGVHRNNVVVGLTNALASRFPVTERIVGPDFFAAMARIFIGLHPPRSPVLLGYGNDLAGFVARFEPAAELSYLPDVIRLEAARGRAYHAADAVPLDPTAFAAQPPDRLADLTFELHPAAAIIRSNHPVVTIWAMNAGEADVRPIDPWAGEDALVTRPHLTVLVRHLPPGGGAFLSAVAAGTTFGEAVTVGSATPGFDLALNIAGMLQAGLIVAIR